MEDIHRTGAKRFSVAVPRRVIFSDTSMLESNRAVLPMVMGTDTHSSSRLLLHKSIIRRNRAGANLHVILGRHTNILTAGPKYLFHIDIIDFIMAQNLS